MAGGPLCQAGLTPSVLAPLDTRPGRTVTWVHSASVGPTPVRGHLTHFPNPAAGPEGGSLERIPVSADEGAGATTAQDSKSPKN